MLDSSKLKEFADGNFKFDENGRKLSKWVEKRFQRVCFPGVSKGVIVWEWVNATTIENVVGNEEIAHNEQFLLFPQ